MERCNVSPNSGRDRSAGLRTTDHNHAKKKLIICKQRGLRTLHGVVFQLFMKCILCTVIRSISHGLRIDRCLWEDRQPREKKLIICKHRGLRTLHGVVFQLFMKCILWTVIRSFSHVLARLRASRRRNQLETSYSLRPSDQDTFDIGGRRRTGH